VRVAPSKELLRFLDYRDIEILRLLYEHPGLWYGRIRAILGGDPKSILKHLKYLEELGLVKKVVTKFGFGICGRNVHKYYLTEKGMEVVEWLKKSQSHK